MKRILASGLAAAFSVALVACGGGENQQQAEATAEPATEAAEATEGESAELSVPDWMHVDSEAQTVTLDITAGATDANNHWNFNGHFKGDAAIVVPEGYSVTINFKNADPANPHSLAIDPRTGGTWPAMFTDAEPAFEGAETAGAADMTEATQPGESETITFTADTAGDYSMVCYVPAHAATGMWVGFRVSADGEAGVQAE
ncbi:MAG: sulfocyanin-like copper-binding protein [Gemmatimonadota bacterium]